MPRSKYSAIEKLALINAFEASGQSYEAFSRQYGYAPLARAIQP